MPELQAATAPSCSLSRLLCPLQMVPPACSVLGMVDGAVLLVDAVEGPLAQTKFVLAKALSRGLAPVVVLNKVDRPAATQSRCDAVASQLFDLFASLGADDRQLDFPVLYASAKQVWASSILRALGSRNGWSGTHTPSVHLAWQRRPIHFRK